MRIWGGVKHLCPTPTLLCLLIHQGPPANACLRAHAPLPTMQRAMAARIGALTDEKKTLTAQNAELGRELVKYREAVATLTGYGEFAENATREMMARAIAAEDAKTNAEAEVEELKKELLKAQAALPAPDVCLRRSTPRDTYGPDQVSGFSSKRRKSAV